MVLYIMSKERYADDLSGRGVEQAGARWNEKGLPALYLAENRSLAILETIVHCRNIKELNNRLVLSVEVPDEFTELFDRRKLPDAWNTVPWNHYTINKGSEWLKAFGNLALKVPSAIVPEEFIFMVNPRHPEFRRIKVKAKEIFKPDHRLVLLK